MMNKNNFSNGNVVERLSSGHTCLQANEMEKLRSALTAVTEQV